jgi:hypothetical protein
MEESVVPSSAKTKVDVSQTPTIPQSHVSIETHTGSSNTSNNESKHIKEDNIETDHHSLHSLDTNHELLQNSEPFEPAINIPEHLYHNIKLKLTSLANRDRILQIKVSKYQKTHEHLNMFIIFVSTFLGIYETFRVKIDDLIKTEFLDVGSNIIPIVLSGVITCSASIIKVKKYQEKTDAIHLIREKVSVARSNLKTVQEHLLFCKTETELRQIKKFYFKTSFDSYSLAQSYLDKYVKEIDYQKYGDKINFSDKYSIHKSVLTDDSLDCNSFTTKSDETNSNDIERDSTLESSHSYDFRTNPDTRP